MWNTLQEFFGSTAHSPSWASFGMFVSLATVGARAIYGTPWDHESGRPTRKEVKGMLSDCHANSGELVRTQIQTINDTITIEHNFQKEFREEMREQVKSMNATMVKHLEAHGQ